MGSYLVVKMLGGRVQSWCVVMMLVALCRQLLFSDCGHNSADSWVGTLELTHMAQVAGRWALVRARTGESAGTVQTLAGSTGDFVPFSCRALCLTRLLGKGEPSCFLLLPLHCGSLL